MQKKSILPADTFIVSCRTVLHDEDRKLLSMLYQPIIGSTAINLYFTLWSYLDKCEILSCTWTHHHLMAGMQVKLEEIVEARQKLEGIGLLRTYCKEGSINNYIYELYSPIDAHEFLENPILSTSLYQNIGEQEYGKIVSYFKIPRLNLQGYENITCLFQEVFEPTAIISLEHQGLKKIHQLGISIEPTIQIDNCIHSIPEEMLHYRSITKEMRNIIIQLSFVYNFSEETMGDIIRNSLNEKHTIDIPKLRDNCRRYYQFENSGKLPTIIYRNQPEYLRSTPTKITKKAQMIDFFESTSPHDFLVGKNRGAKLSKNDSIILEYLLVDLKFTPGVVNVLIDFVLKINDNKLTKAFVESIAAQWKRSNIESVEAAMNLAEKEYKSRNQRVKKEIKKVEVKPQWFDQKVDSKEVSEDERQAFLRRIQHIK